MWLEGAYMSSKQVQRSAPFFLSNSDGFSRPVKAIWLETMKQSNHSHLSPSCHKHIAMLNQNKPLTTIKVQVYL